MSDVLTDMFARPVNPRPPLEDRPTRSVPAPPPDLADRPGHKVTRELLRMSGTSRAAMYSPPVHRRSCSCGWEAQSSVPTVVDHLQERHLLAVTTTPEPTSSTNN